MQLHTQHRADTVQVPRRYIATVQRCKKVHLQHAGQYARNTHTQSTRSRMKVYADEILFVAPCQKPGLHMPTNEATECAVLEFEVST